MKRNCDNCKHEYTADTRNLKRGWGLCCSKSCAASKREKKTGHFSRLLQSRTNSWFTDAINLKMRIQNEQEDLVNYG